MLNFRTFLWKIVVGWITSSSNLQHEVEDTLDIAVVSLPSVAVKLYKPTLRCWSRSAAKRDSAFCSSWPEVFNFLANSSRVRHGTWT